jgi:hypothetical protein
VRSKWDGENAELSVEIRQQKIKPSVSTGGNAGERKTGDLLRKSQRQREEDPTKKANKKFWISAKTQ